MRPTSILRVPVLAGVALLLTAAAAGAAAGGGVGQGPEAPGPRVRGGEGVEAGADTLRSLQELRAFLADAEPVLEIGLDEGGDRRPLARVADAEFGPRGRLFVADRRVQVVRIFGPEGEFVQELGAGSGKGHQLVAPVDLALDASGRLYVAEEMGRVSVYRPSGDVYEFDRTFGVPGYAEGVCTMSGRAYVMQRGRGSRVEIRAPDGEKVGAFAPLRVTRSDLRGLYGRGSIACLEDRRSVVLASRFRGRVEAFTSAGEERWTTSLPEFQPAEITVRSDGYRVSGTGDGTDYVVSTSRFLGGTFLVQVVRDPPFSRTPSYAFDRYRTYGVAVRGGATVRLDETVPQVVDLHDGRMAVVRREPRWHVVVFHIGG